jgi:P-type Cu2+ transporter
MSGAELSCFHCGLPVPAGCDFVVAIEGAAQPMCCAGCAAVAQAIVDGGLAAYYQQRAKLPNRPSEVLPDSLVDALGRHGLFDHPEVQKSFVTPVGEHEREAALILEGITCAACVWLNERHLQGFDGVVAVDVNYATRRARVRWDVRRTQLSAILRAIAAIGYQAHPYDTQRAESLAKRERTTALWRVFVAGFGMMQVMMYALPVYLADIGGDMRVDIAQLMRWASLILTAPVVLYSAAPFFTRAWRDLRHRRVGMDVPVAIGVGAAFAASAWATFTGVGEVYFDSVTMFVFFLLSGRYLELLARQRAARGVEAVSLALPSLANRYEVWPGGQTSACAVADLRVDDVVLVRPGESVPADGVVIDGRTQVDESLLTGESRAVDKAVGSALVGGSVIINSPVVMRVSAVGEGTRVAAIARLMARAAAEKPRIVVLADRIAGHFVAVLLLMAVLSAAVWWWLDPSQMFNVFVAVLVVSCPCALSLATPTALTVGTGALAARGLLVTRGHAIETLAKVDCVVFDKTGTLTEGRFAVRQVCDATGLDFGEGMGEQEALTRVLGVAAALEQGSEHPIARALRDSFAGGVLPTVSELRAITGAGVEGLIDGVTWRIGHPEFVAKLHALALPRAWLAKVSAGDTAITLGNSQGWVALVLLGDTVRSDAAETIAMLQSQGLVSYLLSGDAAPAVAQVAQAVGITDAQRQWAASSPEQKHARIKQMQSEGHVVAMVGDGVNDAPVLAQAQVSVAMAGGADLARSHADVVLLGTRLRALSDGVAISRKTMRIVRQNLIWSAFYNASAVPLAMMGWVTPWMAGIGMAASSLLVVLNALRLQEKRT